MSQPSQSSTKFHIYRQVIKSKALMESRTTEYSQSSTTIVIVASPDTNGNAFISFKTASFRSLSWHIHTAIYSVDECGLVKNSSVCYGGHHETGANAFKYATRAREAVSRRCFHQIL
ncbi:unnamed protein product [Albugo candida]|uniref:Uncharacterized protein n=1 Tax=Albugo candida TaxID=65357 RepID=A0A024FUC3_9STRA|nr:unnamed protein product [Albugo candida]|eukprot:CCI10482.1 unnamed protein product [Albugo candida]